MTAKPFFRAKEPTVHFSADLTSWTTLQRQLREMKRGQSRKIVRQTIREVTKPVFQRVRAHAASLARPDDKRGVATRSLMSAVARSLKLRAIRRSRKRIGMQILIAATSDELERARRAIGPIKKAKGYAPAHFHLGHRLPGGRRVAANKWMKYAVNLEKAKWLRDFALVVHRRVGEALKPK